MCLICGVLGTAFVYGGSRAPLCWKPPSPPARRPCWRFTSAYVVTFNAGAVPGILYSLYNSGRITRAADFLTSGAFLWNLGMATAMALLWYSGLLLYGMASGAIGKNRRVGGVCVVLQRHDPVRELCSVGLPGSGRARAAETIQGFVKGMVFIVGAIFIIAFGISMQ